MAPLLAEVNAIARPNLYSHLGNSLTYWLYVAEITEGCAVEPHTDFRNRLVVSKVAHPFVEW